MERTAETIQLPRAAKAIAKRFTDPNPGRYNLVYVRLRRSGGRLELTATDGHKLARWAQPDDGPDLTIYLPADPLGKLALGPAPAGLYLELHADGRCVYRHGRGRFTLANAMPDDGPDVPSWPTLDHAIPRHATEPGSTAEPVGAWIGVNPDHLIGVAEVLAQVTADDPKVFAARYAHRSPGKPMSWHCKTASGEMTVVLMPAPIADDIRGTPVASFPEPETADRDQEQPASVAA